MKLMRWDVFCRVIDNHGDAGVCWRLCRELAARGHTARLWIDDPRALAWMAPDQPPRCSVHPWPTDAWAPAEGPADVVIEAFGCELPESVQAQLPGRIRHWLNLEYLSAEGYVERSHGLPSPVLSGPAQGITKRFFYPGFSHQTGGLLREADLAQRQASHNPEAYWRQLGVPFIPAEQRVSLFCYPKAPVDWLVQAYTEALGHTPWRLLICGDTVGPTVSPPSLTVQRLPWLSQADYDALLWSCDLNVVRGEDSFVRALWAGKPLLWHIYPQTDGAHWPKLESFMALWGPDEDAQNWRALWQHWNGAPGPSPTEAIGTLRSNRVHNALRTRLLAQKDLVSQLCEAVQG